MNLTTNTESFYTRVYRPKPLVLLSNSVLIIGVGLVVGGPLFFLIRDVIHVIRYGSDGRLFGLAFLLVLGVPLLILSLLYVRMALTYLAQFFSYVKVSSVGLEYQFWPFIGIRCRWSEVDYIGKQIFIADAIFLKNGEQFGPLLSKRFPGLFHFRIRQAIPLSGFSGWPRGQLAEDLYQYAPHLFNREGKE